MLRKRIEKLERQQPLATGDLIKRWEQMAMASLSRDEQALIKESECARRRPPANSDAKLAAIQSYEEALAAAITEISDDDLKRIVVTLDATAAVVG
jgi:hypothetical protein